MDAGRILLVSAFAGFSFLVQPLGAAQQSATDPVQQTVYLAGQSAWSNTGPTTAPTISASPNDRYAYPQSGTPTASGQPPSISARAQTAVSDTATSLRDGFQAGAQQVQDWAGSASRQVQAAGGSVRNAAEQTFGASAYPAQSTSPFAAPPPAPSANSGTRGNFAPPPWPNASTAAPTAPAMSWNDSPNAAPADRSILTGTSPTQANGGWSSIGSNVASPPLLIPQLPTSSNGIAPAGNAASRSAPVTPAEASGNLQPLDGSLTTNPSRQTTNPSTTAANNWATGWDNNSATSRATIGRSANSPPLAITGRESDLVPVQPAANASRRSKESAPAKTNEFWADDPWKQPQQSLPAGQNVAKPAVTAPANNATPVSSPFNSSPSFNSPPVGPTAANVSLSGPSPSATQPARSPNAINHNQPTGEQQPWVPMVVAVLALAGSLAGNLFLGWSYMDARQKYQSLVRRTADTFRRTKQAAA